MVWLHHFFTMGAGPDVNAVFGIATMIIAIPTGAKIFNWLFTMYRGRVRLSTPMLWTLGFIVTFSIGGMTGVLLAVPAADFVLHNSLFLVAHFHNMLIPAMFGYFAGLSYWFPKAFGFTLDEKLGRNAFWCWLVGFLLAFLPLYALGFMGMTRRLMHYEEPAWQLLLAVAALGALVILAGIVFQFAQVIVSIAKRHEYRDLTGDPWNGRTLEWATSSPPPLYNFAVTPQVDDIDVYWAMKENGRARERPAGYGKIHMPKNTGAGFIAGAFSFLFGFAMIWHIWWLAITGLLGALATLVVRSFDDDTDYYLPADEVQRIEDRRFEQLAAVAN
jgi:cytochrome o ubiquinol oxidase subunit I